MSGHIAIKKTMDRVLTEFFFFFFFFFLVFFCFVFGLGFVVICLDFAYLVIFVKGYSEMSCQ